MLQRASVFCNFYIRVDREALVSERAFDVGSVVFKAMSTKNSFLNSAPTCDFDLIAISETWLSDCVYSSELIDYDLFSVFRCNRNFSTLGLSRDGGVLLLPLVLKWLMFRQFVRVCLPLMCFAVK
jgi:hypothetical protein